MKTKRILALLLGFSLLVPATAQARDMNVYVNNQYLVRDVQIVNDFDMLPVLDIASELGFAATFDGTTAVLSSPQQQYTFTLGSPDVYNKDGRWYGLDVVPQMINGKFMIPAKFFQDAMGKPYFWDDVTDSVFLDSNNEYNWLISTPEYKQAKKDMTTYVNIYAPDGRVKSVLKKDVQAWKNVGWYDTNYVNMYYPGSFKPMQVHVWDMQYYLKEHWYLEPVYVIYDEKGNELWYTKSDVERGAYISLDSAIQIAKSFCETHMPISEDDISDAIYWYDVTRSQILSWLYECYFTDFNAQNYLIAVSYTNYSVYISVNKYTGEAKYCGGGQDYWRGSCDF